MKHYITSLALILLLGHFSVSAAKKLYRYQDENSQWHYTDIPNSTTSLRTTETLLIPTEEKRKSLSLVNDGNEQNPDYYMHNDLFMPVEVLVYIIQSTNIEATPPLPLQKIISPKSKQHLFTIRQIDPYSKASFEFSYEEVFGDPDSIHKDTAIYQLPFERGQSFLVSQAFNGATSHTDDQNRYAVDFSMPIGTKILASRAGIIVDVEQDFYDNGLQKKYRSKANSIRILHDDGSMAIYAHLKGDRVFVYVGDRINAGDLIAESGNTGFSSGPHLHFAVQMNKGLHLQSIPFKFTLKNHQRITPTLGEALTASP